MCRLIQGLGYSVIMSAVAAITAHWACLSENGIFLGVLTSVIQLSPVLTMPLSGALCTSRWGWPSVYYVHGALTFLLSCTWGIVYRNNPQKHPWIAGAELQKIVEGKGLVAKRVSSVIPWKAMFRSPSIWAILVATLGNMFGIQLLIYYTPTYLKHILNFDLLSSGILSAMPYLTQFGVKIVAGLLSDNTPCLSETVRVKIFNSIAFFGMAGFMAGLGFVPAGLTKVGVGLLVCSAAILGFNAGGFFKSATLVARQFSPMVMGFVQLITCIVLLILPYIKGAIVKNDDDIPEWRIAFLVAASLLCLCNAVFFVLGSGNAAQWALGESHNSPGSKKPDKPEQDETRVAKDGKQKAEVANESVCDYQSTV